MIRSARAAAMALILTASTAGAGSDAPSFDFASIDGGSYSTADWRGMPVLVVNTASMCGFTPQYEDLQTLSDLYKDRAVVLAVPSDDFNQELASDSEVKAFCDVNYDLTLPMTTIEHVAAGTVHPMFAWLRDTQGYVPDWNFNKVLLGPDGSFIAAWGSGTKPMSDKITAALDAAMTAR